MTACTTPAPSTPSIIPQTPPEPPVAETTAAPSPRPRFLTLTQVQDMTGMKTTNVYALIKDGKFPRQVKQGRRSYWWEHEVVAYMESLPRA